MQAHSAFEGRGGKPPAALKQKIIDSFGSVDACIKELAGAAITQFGSGWAWLVMAGDKLKGKNRQRRSAVYIRHETSADHYVWEHAYYLDYQNRRADYVNTVLDKLINWEFALKNVG